MPQRIFLGWDEPFLKPAVAWLLARKEQFPGMLILVPTAQSGRRLRETLAEIGGAILSANVVTPGALLRTDDPEVAADWIEQVAWAEVFESIEDWSVYTALFSEKPGDGSDWATAISFEMLKLRRALQENGLTLGTAAWPLRETIEADRWAALAKLEKLVEAKLASWNFKSRSHSLADGLRLPSVSHIVLAGIAEMPPLLERTLLAWQGEMSILIGAPESAEDHFSMAGRPLEHWAKAPMPWPEDDQGSVKIVADPRQQAIEALQSVARAGRPSNEIALGSADAGNRPGNPTGVQPRGLDRISSGGHFRR